ncbi:MAG: hypothetical protein R3E66_16770 [bacterium]
MAVVLPCATATAFTPPRIGHQYLTIGVTNEPGLMIDDTAPEGVSQHAVVWSQRLRLGLQHAVHTNFYASAEVELGGTYFNPHTANASGKSASDGAFAWQVAVATRVIPGGDDGGFHLGWGISLMRASLEESPLYVLGFDVRTGFLLWQGDSFGLIDVGYVFPFIQGVALPADFSGMQERASQDWSLHRAFVSLNVGF